MKKTVNVLIVAALLVMTFGVMTASAADPVITPWATGIDLQNLSASDATYIIDFYDSAGAPAYTYTPAGPISAHGAANVYLPSLGTMPTGQFAGVVSSDQPLAAVASVNSYSASDPQFGGGDIYIGTALPDNTLVFPLVYKNHTVRRWYSSLSVQNTSASSQTITLKLYNNGSSTPQVTKTATLAGNGSVTFNLQDATGYEAFGPFGSATVEGTAPLAGVANSLTLGRMTNPNTNFLDTVDTLYRAFTAAQFGQDVILPLVYKNYNGWTTGINVVNTTATPTTAEVTYKKADGTTWTDSMALGANAMGTFYTPANTTGLPDGFFGSATLHSTDAAAKIAVVVASQRYLASGAQGVAYEGSLGTQATNCASLPVTHNRTTWKTGINMQNLGAAAGTYTLKFFSSVSGIPNGQDLSVTIPAGQPLTVYMPAYNTPATPGYTQVGFAGSVDIQGNQPLLVNVANSRADATSHGVASNYVGINYTCP